MLPAASFAEQKEAAIRQKMYIAGILNPRFRLVPEDLSVLSIGLRANDIEPRLDSILCIPEQAGTIGLPLKMSQNQIVRIVSRCIDPCRRTSLARNDPESHERILVASLGIMFHFE